jgi:biotin transport system substrate-specific component
MFLCGGLLGKKYGTISMCVYVFMGAVGVPVFAGFKAGIGVLAGPTGGYIVAYIIGAFIIGLLIEKLGCILSLIIGLIICYVTGTLWFVLSTGCTTATAITSCVLPFAALDAIKIFVASLLIKRLRPFLYK